MSPLYFIHGAGDFSLLLSLVPVVSYHNADLDKKSIVKENNGKTGIYL